MRTCHRTLLPATLLLSIALAVLPASAFYNPTTGRWLSRDPIEEQGGQNIYGIVGNNPVTQIDLYGLIIGPDRIIALDKTYPSTQITGYSSGNVCWWEAGPHLAISGPRNRNAVDVYPTSESFNPGDAQIIAHLPDGGREDLFITVRRPKYLTRTPYRGPTWATAVGVVNFSAIFDLQVDDQFHSPLQGVPVSESIRWIRNNVIGFLPTTGGGSTDEEGQIQDIYWVNFAGSGGWASVDQTVTVGNWSASLWTMIYASGSWSGTLRTGFE